MSTAGGVVRMPAATLFEAAVALLVFLAGAAGAGFVAADPGPGARVTTDCACTDAHRPGSRRTGGLGWLVGFAAGAIATGPRRGGILQLGGETPAFLLGGDLLGERTLAFDRT